MNQLAQTQRQSAADRAQAVGAGQVTKQHRHGLIPAGKALGGTLAIVMGNHIGEPSARDMLEQLTEQTGDLIS